jgi:hypothetical protein
MRLKLKSRDFMPIFLVVISAICCFIDIIAGYNATLNNLIAFLTVVLSVYLCYVYRHNIALFLVMIFIAYTNYSVAVAVYLDPTIRPNGMYYQITSAGTYGKGIICTMIFEICMILFSLKVIHDPQKVKFKEDFSKSIVDYNPVIALGAVIVYAVVFFSAFHFGTDGSRGGTSSVAEYRSIFAIIGFYYSGRKNAYKYIWTILIAITSLLVLMSGNRVDMFGGVIVLIAFWYSDFFDYKKVLLMIPFAVIVFAAVGFTRGGFSFSGDIFENAISVLSEDKLTYEGAVYGYLPSLATIELTDRIDFSEKANLFIQHVVYTFTIGKASDINPDLSSYSHNYYQHWYGFISPLYFYFWFRYIGAFLFVFLFNAYNRLFQKFINTKPIRFIDKLANIMAWFFVGTVGRWYCYGPMALLRGMFICAVIYCIVYFGELLLRGRIKIF